MGGMLRPLSLFRFYSVVIILCLWTGLTGAQVPQYPNNNLNPLEKIGDYLVDDRVDLYDRYVYFDDQTVDEKVSLSLPVISNQDVQDWLIDTVAEIMTVSPTQYPLHIRKIYDYFTKDGWNYFLGQWQGAQIEELVMRRNYTMTALVMKMPQILAKGRDKGVYRWIVDVPVMLSYTQPTGQIQSYETILRLELTRIPMQKDTRLIAIDGWGLAPQDPPPEDAKTQ
jgi:hypothetical protein